MKSSLFTLLLCLSGQFHFTGLLYSEDLDPLKGAKSLEALSADFAKRAVQLQRLEAFEVQGTQEVFDRHEASYGNIKKRRFHVWAKGGKIKEQVEYLGNDGQVEQIHTYFLNDKNLVFQVSKGVTEAQIFDVTHGPGCSTFYLFDPAFMEYSFLFLEANPVFGVPAMSIPKLGDIKVWDKVTEMAKACVIDEKGIAHLIVGGAIGQCAVDFSPGSTAQAGFFPKSLKFSRANKDPICEIEVLETFQDKTLGEIAKTLRMEAYTEQGPKGGPRPVTHVGTWTYHIDKFEMNPKLDDDILDFDPVICSRIIDVSAETSIDVPK